MQKVNSTLTEVHPSPAKFLKGDEDSLLKNGA